MDFGASTQGLGPAFRHDAGSRSFTRQGLSFLAGGAIGNSVAITPAVHAVFGTFLIPVTEEFGWPRASFSAILMIIAVAAAIVYPLCGRLADRVGGRAVLATGYGLFALALGALAFLDGSLPLLYLGFLMVGIFGAIPSTALLSKIVSERFPGHATALAVTAGGGNAVGCIVMPIVAATVLHAHGWRAAYAAIAMLVLVVGALSVILLGKNGAQVRFSGPTAEIGDVRPVLSNPIFWVLMLAIGFGAGGTTVILSHIVPILAERGIGLGEATAAVSIFALVSLPAQILSGRLLDKISSPRIAIASYMAGAPGLALIGFGGNWTETVVGVSLLGIASGMQFAALPYFVGRYFGFSHFGLLVGLMYSAVVLAQGLFPVLLDGSFDVTGTYHSAIVLACIAYLVGGGSLVLLPPYRWRGCAAASPCQPPKPDRYESLKSPLENPLSDDTPKQSKEK